MSTPRLVADIRPGISSSSPRQLTAIGSILYFSANDGISGFELWKTDGTSSGTTQVADIRPVISSSYPGNFTAIDNTIYFIANDGIRGFELWRTDGTSDGTSLVADINTNNSGYGPSSLIAIENTLYFVHNDGTSGYEFWKTDGSITTLVADINPGIGNSDPREFTAIGSTLFFTARDGIGGRDLWRTDDFNTGIIRLTDFDAIPLFPSYVGRWNPQSLTRVGNTIFFAGPGESNEFALWKSDGTPAGTNRIIDFQLGVYDFGALQFAGVGETLFFTAFDEYNGRELWKTDGTALGTQRITDIRQGPYSSGISQLTAVGNTLFFTANDGISGTELWKTDGTSAGTQLVADINPGIADSNPSNLTAVGNSLFFTAFDRSNGHELWRTDGTTSGAIRITDTGSAFAASPGYPTLVGNTLFFTAELDNNGNELWALDITELLDGSNSGAASFAISGLLAPGNYLHATLNSSDPDGNGSFTYSWQTSSNGSAWTTVGSNRPSYRLTANDAGKQLRLLVSYEDGGGFNETVVTSAGTVAYSLTHPILEILAKDIIYKRSHAIGSLIEELPGLPYVVNKIWNDTESGLYALGLSAPSAPSVLVFRGTGDGADFWDDLNPKGIGFGQFSKAYDSIRKWLEDQPTTFSPIITGHSLGGSLAQWAAADATGNDHGKGTIRLGEVVTFNSPGISQKESFNSEIYGDVQIGAHAFNPLLTGSVTHYITSSDLISLGGSKYLPGSYKLFDYSSFPDPGIRQHLNPVLVPALPFSGLIKQAENDPAEKPFWFLNSPLFGYNTDLDFVLVRLALAGIAKGFGALPGGVGIIVADIINRFNKAIRSRFDTENLRSSLGEVLYLPGVKEGLEAAMSFASVAAEAATERVQAAFSALVSGGREALDAIANLPGDVWDEIANATPTTWNSLSKWTANAWRDSVDFSASVWQSLISPAFNFAQPFITTAVKQVFHLPTTPGFLPFAAAATFEPSSAEDQASLDQPATLRSFSLASFDAPAAVQTIDVSVALSQPSAELVTLQFQTVDRTAQAGVDYRALSGTLQFQPGETEKFVTIELLTPPQASGMDFALRLSNLQNAQFLASEEIVVSLLANQAPVVASAPADRFAPIEEPLFFALPSDTFSDANSSQGDFLAYSASLSDGSPLPDWLQFDPETLSFAGTPPASALGSLAITITATDSAQSQASATFALLLVANDGVASFTITGTPAVGNILTATTSSPDPDGNGTFSYTWQSSTDVNAWSPVGDNSASYLIASADQGRQLRLVVSYTDGQGFSEAVTTAGGSVPFVNDGAATFSISGTPAVGNTLTATTSSADPDGNGAFTYSWQASTDGSTWNPVGTNSSSYLIASADQGNQLSLVVSYTDGQGFSEAVTTAGGSVTFVNDGAATFSISGTPAVSNTLTATTSSPDPDGNGAFTYSWQASTDGSTWSSIVGDGPSYTVTAVDLGRELQLQVSYTDAEGFAELLTIPYGWLEELPATAGGTHFTVSDPLIPDLQITSQGSPDLLELEAAVSATLHARTNSTWSRGFVAYNAGSPTAPGTGERIPVTGLGRYSFVAKAIPEATTAIVLEPDQNTAYFLHDTYSAFFSGLNLAPDSYGRASAQRLLNIDRITMGSAGGTSIVDLTSPDYITGPMTVFGAARGTSIVWGSDADDSYISAGSDAVIYGGLGRNAYTLGSGRETMQYRQMSDAIGATDQIRGFDPNLDRLEFWSATDQQRSTPSLVNNLSSSLLAWGGHTIEFLDQPTLSLADLTILQATVM